MAPPDSPECLETLNLIENSPEPESPQSDHRPETPQSDQTKIKLDLHSAISQAEIRNLQRLEQMNVAQHIIISQPSTSQMAQPILHHNTDETAHLTRPIDIQMPSARDSPTGDPLGSLRHRESRGITTWVGTFNDAGVLRAPRELNH
ncbi:hypothetical protein EVAR_39000_1 [Eumeta japonica]|uniref:Uncharacterized protein n=1 Tax=Eumeta variegata TaxID=151549 RepID=A0A4C1WRT5_EUMVA|nr:hypothetical protein EVAR_39000_1 [Eumeta japonica]